MKNYLLLLVLVLFANHFVSAQNNPAVKAKGLDSLLLEAVSANDLAQVKSLVEQGADVNAEYEYNYYKAPLLMFAGAYADLAMVQYLIAQKADYKKKGLLYGNKGSIYGSLLVLAAGENKLDLLKYLLEDLSIDIEDKELSTDGAEGWNALQTACFTGAVESVSYLLKRGANPNAQDNTGETPLHFAIMNKRTEIARLLIEKGGDVNAKNRQSNTPLYYIHDVSSTQLLVENGADVNAKHNLGSSTLHWVIARGDLEIAQILIEKGANVNARDIDGITPLYLVNDLNAAQLLLAKGADINALDKDGNNALHYRLINNGYSIYTRSDKRIIAFFIAQGLNNNTRNKVGKTPEDILNDLGYRNFESLTEESKFIWSLQAEDGSVFKEGESIPISMVSQKFRLVCNNYLFQTNYPNRMEIIQLRGGWRIHNPTLRDINSHTLRDLNLSNLAGNRFEIKFLEPGFNPLGKFETNTTSSFSFSIKE